MIIRHSSLAMMKFVPHIAGFLEIFEVCRMPILMDFIAIKNFKPEVTKFQLTRNIHLSPTLISFAKIVQPLSNNTIILEYYSKQS